MGGSGVLGGKDSVQSCPGTHSLDPSGGVELVSMQPHGGHPGTCTGGSHDGGGTKVDQIVVGVAVVVIVGTVVHTLGYVVVGSVHAQGGHAVVVGQIVGGPVGGV